MRATRAQIIALARAVGADGNQADEYELTAMATREHMHPHTIVCARELQSGARITLRPDGTDPAEDDELTDDAPICPHCGAAEGEFCRKLAKGEKVCASMGMEIKEL